MGIFFSVLLIIAGAILTALKILNVLDVSLWIGLAIVAVGVISLMISYRADSTGDFNNFAVVGNSANQSVTSSIGGAVGNALTGIMNIGQSLSPFGAGILGGGGGWLF